MDKKLKLVLVNPRRLPLHGVILIMVQEEIIAEIIGVVLDIIRRDVIDLDRRYHRREDERPTDGVVKRVLEQVVVMVMVMEEDVDVHVRLLADVVRCRVILARAVVIIDEIVVRRLVVRVRARTRLVKVKISHFGSVSVCVCLCNC